MSTVPAPAHDLWHERFDDVEQQRLLDEDTSAFTGVSGILLLIVSTFWHSKLGLQVLIEDYVHEEGLKLFSITLLNFFIIAFGALAFFSVLKIAFTGGDA